MRRVISALKTGDGGRERLISKCHTPTRINPQLYMRVCFYRRRRAYNAFNRANQQSKKNNHLFAQAFEKTNLNRTTRRWWYGAVLKRPISYPVFGVGGDLGVGGHGRGSFRFHDRGWPRETNGERKAAVRRPPAWGESLF
jgi:hypothetical protein